MKPRYAMPLQIILAVVLLLAASLSRAQTFESGARVYLYQPGTITGTLLAAPSSIETYWDLGVVYPNPFSPGGYSSYGFVNIATYHAGQTSDTSPFIPTDGGQPILLSMTYIRPGDTDFSIVTTGTVPGQSVFTGSTTWQQTAGVIFGPNHTADVGFAFPGMNVASFSDFPLRMRVTNVSALGMCQ